MKTPVINPILKKEMRVEARTVKLPLSLMLYALIMTGIARLIVLSASNSYYDGYGVNFQSYTGSFWVLAAVQCAMICIIMPTITAGSISGEREKQTLEIMLTTPVSPFAIAMGKLNASMVKLMLYVICGLPAMGICFIYGGIQWTNLLVFLLNILVCAYFVGSIGIFCSARYKKTVPAIIMTLVIETLFYILPVTVMMVDFERQYQKYVELVNYQINLGYLPMLLLINPLFGAVNFLLKTSLGYDLAAYVANGMGSTWTSAKGMSVVTSIWTPLYLIVTIAFVLFFLFLASRRIDYSRRKNRKMKK